jgi:hypothetical protein
VAVYTGTPLPVAGSVRSTRGGVGPAHPGVIMCARSRWKNLLRTIDIGGPFEGPRPPGRGSGVSGAARGERQWRPVPCRPAVPQSRPRACEANVPHVLFPRKLNRKRAGTLRRTRKRLIETRTQPKSNQSEKDSVRISQVHRLATEGSSVIPHHHGGKSRPARSPHAANPTNLRLFHSLHGARQFRLLPTIYTPSLVSLLDTREHSFPNVTSNQTGGRS